VRGVRTRGEVGERSEGFGVPVVVVDVVEVSPHRLARLRAEMRGRGEVAIWPRRDLFQQVAANAHGGGPAVAVMHVLVPSREGVARDQDDDR
jgi:hypothetical protein